MAYASESHTSSSSALQHVSEKTKLSFLILDDNPLKVFSLPLLLKADLSSAIKEIVLISSNNPPILSKLRPFYPESMKKGRVYSPEEWISTAKTEYGRLINDSESLVVVFVDFHLSAAVNSLPFITYVKEKKDVTTVLIGISTCGQDDAKSDSEFQKFLSLVVQNFPLISSDFINEVSRSITSTTARKLITSNLLQLLLSIDKRKLSWPSDKSDNAPKPVDLGRRWSVAGEADVLGAVGIFSSDEKKPSAVLVAADASVDSKKVVDKSEAIGKSVVSVQKNEGLDKKKSDSSSDEAEVENSHDVPGVTQVSKKRKLNVGLPLRKL